MTRRGERLHEHILWIAKDVFLELGFERASMDVVANRAETSKRSVYAHFESKEKLFLAVIELVHGLFLNRLRQPSHYAENPEDALVLFCARYLELLTYEGSIQMCRVSMGQAARFPEQATQYHEVLFTEVHERLSDYLHMAQGTSTRASADGAQRLLGQILYPRFTRALFGLDPLSTSLDETLAPNVDLGPVRSAVVDLLQGLGRA